MRVGFLGLLFMVFLTLKLCEVITWSWWWVTAPLWSIPVLIIGLPLIVFIFGGGCILISTFWKEVVKRSKK